MATPTNHWKLGLFVVIGFVLALSMVWVLGARSMTKEVVRYVSYFDESVQGLETGSPIKFRGVTIGTVGKIDVAPDHRHVEVTSELGVGVLSRLGLDVARGVVIKGAHTKLGMATDLRVQLASMGLTGVKFLNLDFFMVGDYPKPELPFRVAENYIPVAPSTMKNLEDSLVRTMNRLPDIADQMAGILARVDNLLGEVKDKRLSEQIVTTLDGANSVIAEARELLGQVHADKLSTQAQKTLADLDVTLNRMNSLLARVDGDKGLLASFGHASDALGDTVRNADGVGEQLQDTLRSVDSAAKSIHKFADALERDPDMLIKGHAKGNR
jgi:paraquat-inducible protein B